MPIVLIISDSVNTHKLTMSLGSFTLGRSSSCHISLLDPMVSGKHLTISLNLQKRVFIKDLNSSNGTFLNGAKVTDCIVSLEDEVTVGDVRIWIDESCLTTKERAFHGSATQKTKIKFVDLGQDITNSDMGPNNPKTNSDISVSMKFKPRDLEEKKNKERPNIIQPEVQTVSTKEFNQQDDTNLTKIIRDPTKTSPLATKNEQKEKTSIGYKLKNLWKK
jgi:hypothetical protein